MGQTFRDLRIYQISAELAEEIGKIVTTLPTLEQFRLSDQILRSSRSITANIAEGFARRRYKKDFIKFLTYSFGSSEETQVHLEVIISSKLFNEKACKNLIKSYKNLGVRIYNFIKTIELNN